MIQKGQQNKNFWGEQNYTSQIRGEGITSVDGYVIRNNHLLMAFEMPASCSLGSFIYAELSHLPRVLMVASGMPLLAAVDTAPIRKLCPE